MIFSKAFFLSDILFYWRNLTPFFQISNPLTIQLLFFFFYLSLSLDLDLVDKSIILAQSFPRIFTDEGPENGNGMADY